MSKMYGNSGQNSCKSSLTTPDGFKNLPRFIFMGPSPDETILTGVDKILSALKKNCIQMYNDECVSLKQLYSRSKSLTYSTSSVQPNGSITSTSGTTEGTVASVITAKTESSGTTVTSQTTITDNVSKKTEYEVTKLEKSTQVSGEGFQMENNNNNNKIESENTLRRKTKIDTNTPESNLSDVNLPVQNLTDQNLSVRKGEKKTIIQSTVYEPSKISQKTIGSKQPSQKSQRPSVKKETPQIEQKQPSKVIRSQDAYPTKEIQPPQEEKPKKEIQSQEAKPKETHQNKTETLTEDYSEGTKKTEKTVKYAPETYERSNNSTRTSERHNNREIMHDEIGTYCNVKSNSKSHSSNESCLEKKLGQIFKTVPNCSVNSYGKSRYFPNMNSLSLCPPKRVKTKSILTKLHVYDDASKVVEIMKPKPSNQYKPRKEEYESIFVVLPNGTTVCFFVLAKLKAKQKRSYYCLK